MHRDLGRLRQLDDGITGDAPQDAAVDRGSVQFTPPHHEEVGPRPLGHEAGGVEHDHLVGVGDDPFDLGQDVRQVVERLDPGGERLAVRGRGARGDHAESLGVPFLRPEGDPVDDDDDRRVLAFAGVEAEVADATGHDAADVGVREPGSLEPLLVEPHHLVDAQGNGQPDRLGRVVEPLDVGAELEYLSFVRADPFEHPVAVQESVIEDRDHRLFLGQPLPIHIND